jgi:capsular polysaccharide biosynthesis protein
MIARSTIDRLTIAALMLTATLPFAAISPAHAGTTQCAVQAEQLRTEAASANPQDAAKALRSIKIAEKICAEGNAH